MNPLQFIIPSLVVLLSAVMVWSGHYGHALVFVGFYAVGYGLAWLKDQ